MPAQSVTVEVGARAPDFHLDDLQGDPIQLSGLLGKPVVLVFLRGFG